MDFQPFFDDDEQIADPIDLIDEDHEPAVLDGTYNVEQDIDEGEMSLIRLRPFQILNMTWDTEVEAKLFYGRYARANGFSFRTRDGTRNGPNGEEWKMKRWVCRKEGFRVAKSTSQGIRKQQPLTRCNCSAGMRVKYDPWLNKWICADFNIAHNHILVSRDQIHLARGHRKITPIDMAQINAMRAVGIRPCYIYKLLELQNGGEENVGCTRTDMYNAIDREKRNEVSKGDVMATFAYFDAIMTRDRGFEYKYTTLGDGVLGNLFWCDSRSKLDYKCFGDLVMFDATFGTNIYGRSLVLFLGVNNHHQTCIFGCGLIKGDTQANYQWLLTTLLAAMDGIPPKTVMTDSDNAMRIALHDTFGDAVPHRLCAWHLMRNARSNIPRDDIVTDFTACLLANTETTFETLWAAMLDKHHIAGHPWILKMYATRKMWSCAHLKDAFFAGIIANSRCESMNFVAKCYISKRRNFYQLVKHYESALARVRSNETAATYATTHSTAVPTTLFKSIESSAAAEYTLESLECFKQELLREGLTIQKPNPETCGMITTYRIGEWNKPDIELTLEFNAEDNSAKCSCKKYESTGFICRHIINVLKNRDVRRLPRSCILPRWTKTAKESQVDGNSVGHHDSDLLRVARQGMLNLACDELCKYASESTDSFAKVRTEVGSLIKWAKEKQNPPEPVYAHNANPMQDPPRTTVRRTETPAPFGPRKKQRKKSKCSLCRSDQHTKPLCPRFLSTLPELNPRQTRAMHAPHIPGSSQQSQAMAQNWTPSQRSSFNAPFSSVACANSPSYSLPTTPASSFNQSSGSWGASEEI